MTKIIGLFSDQMKAEQVVNTLTQAHLGDIDIHIVDEWNEETDIQPPITPAYSTGSGMHGFPVLPRVGMPSLGLGDEEEQFFKRGVQGGGVVVSVKLTNDDDIHQVERILEQQSDRVVRI